MKILRFDESNLNIRELEKTNNFGKLRGDTLIQKLKSEEELIFIQPNSSPIKTTIKNSEEIINNISDDNGLYDIDKSKQFFMSGTRYQPVIIGNNDIRYKLNDIEKTVDFGSSGGQGLGTHETKNVECIQCLFFALRQELGRTITKDDIKELYDENNEISNDFLKFIRVPIDINIAMGSYINDISWINTFITVANAMWEAKPIYTRDKKIFQRSLDIRKKYLYFHIGYDGGISQTISNKYRDLDKVGIPISKWTPADVWAVNIESFSNITANILLTNNFLSLNRIINDEFSTNNLRGISLKKVSNINNITIIINKITPIPTYKFNKCYLSSNPYSSKGAKIIANRNSNITSNIENIEPKSLEFIDIRSFSGPNTISDISGEVLGRTARHGKVGLVRINRIIESINTKFNHNIKLVPVKNDINQDETYLKREIDDIYNFLVENGAEVSNRISQNRINTIPSLISKYQSLVLCHRLYEWSIVRLHDDAKISVSDKLVEDMFHYAMAIRNDEFICPKYIRML